MPTTSTDADDTSYDDLPPSLRALAQRGMRRRYPKGYRLIEEYDSGDSIYVIVRGRVRVYAQGDDGREITYGTYGAGEYVGEMSLDGGPRSASVVAVEPLLCVQITRQTLLQHLAETPEFALELIAKIIRSARAATLSTRQLALNDVYSRLVLLLDAMATTHADGTRAVEKRPTQQDIASQLGCSREMIGRLLRDLEAGGYVQRAGERLLLLRALPARW
jgi:CRP/FNR family cyclic AMP-dependent transcriptional regulator